MQINEYDDTFVYCDRTVAMSPGQDVVDAGQ